MPNFKYKARDKFARLASGTISAENKEAAGKKLHDMGYLPISVSEAAIQQAGNIFDRFSRVSQQDLNVFTRQLFVLQKAGLPLLSGLEAVALQTESQRFKRVIEEVINDIRSGTSFSVSLKSHPEVFNGVYVNMIKAGEAGGLLKDVLERLSQLIEQEMNTRAQIKAATRYPMIAFFTLCVGFTVLIVFVIPRFVALYAQFNAQLPLPTRILIGANRFITKFWYVVILSGSFLAWSFFKFIDSKDGRRVWDNFKLKVPVFGPLVTMLTMSSFAKVTSILMKSGVPILDILDLTASTSGNVIIKGAILNIKESVAQGKGMSEPMRALPIFPPIVVQMVAIGEQTGKVDELLLSVADYYDRESGYMIKNLSTYIEPILILVLGVMVLIMALGIFMPMWNLIRVFKP